MSGIHANHSHGDADRLAADRLDALWDDLVQTGSADLTAATDGDAARLSLISYAGHLVPRSDPVARERIRHRVFADQSEDAMLTPLNAATASGSASHERVSLPRPWTAHPGSRPWWRGSIGILGLAITAALILATIGGIALLRPNDEPRSLPAAGSPDLGLGSPGAEISDTSSEDLLTLELDGPPNTAYSILLARVTLQPEAWWDFPGDPVAEVSEPFDHLVESGTLVLGVGESQHTSEPGNTYELDESPSYVKNPEQTPVTFLMAVAFTSDRMVLESPSGITIHQLGNVPIPAIAGKHEVAVHLTRSTLQPGSGATLPAAPKMSTAFVAVESGTLMARTIPDALVRSGEFGLDIVGSGEPTAFTEAPQDGIEVSAGETLTLDRTFVITDSAVVGDEPVDVLALSYTVEDGSEQAETVPTNFVSINFGPEHCQVDPRPADDLRRLVEGTENAELDPGLRDDASTGEATDATTAAEITATVREALACARFGTPLQIYALFTENALLAGAIANGLTLEEIDELEQATPDDYPPDFVATIAIDEISIFPDGRAGAWIFAGGELAYLTFIQDPETGRWLIDAWDDRERTESAPATPAA